MLREPNASTIAQILGSELSEADAKTQHAIVLGTATGKRMARALAARTGS
jgi:hypothetical protein